MRVDETDTSDGVYECRPLSEYVDTLRGISYAVKLFKALSLVE